MITKEDLDEYIRAGIDLLTKDFEKESYQGQSTILVRMINLIDSFKSSYPDIYYELKFSEDPNWIIQYDNYNLKVEKIFDKYVNTVILDTLELRNEKEYLVYRGLLKAYTDYHDNYNMIKEGIITILTTLCDKLKQIKSEMDTDLKKEGDYTKDEILAMLIDITVGPNSYSPKPEYYVERYHKAIAYFANIKRLNKLKIDFHKLIDHDFLKEKLFGMTTFSVDHINIDLSEENYNEIEFTEDCGDDEEEVYHISSVKDIDLSWGNPEYAKYLLLKSITIYLLLAILDDLNKEEEK